MRLLFIIDSLGPGGAQRQMVNLATGLKQRGHEVEFFTYHPQNHFAPVLESCGIPIHFTAKARRFSLTVPLALHRYFARGDFDLALSFLDTPNLYAEIARTGRSRTRLVVSERFCDPPEGPSAMRRFLIQFHRRADFVTVNSCHQRRRLAGRFSWLENRSATIYNGVDLSVFRPGTDRREGNGPVRLLVVSSVSYYKNGLSLIRALALLRDQFGLCPLVSWVGEHQLQLADRRACAEEMSSLLEQLKLAAQWTWLYRRSDIAELMREHDALVHPSYYEGLPNVVCEAMASGLPVIASDVLDHPLLVQPGRRGLLFKSDDPGDLAAKLKQFCEMGPAERFSLSRQCRAYAEEELSLDRFVHEHEKLFERLTGVSGSGGAGKTACSSRREV